MFQRASCALAHNLVSESEPQGAKDQHPLDGGRPVAASGEDMVNVRFDVSRVSVAVAKPNTM